MHSDSKKRRSSFLVALLFTAGDVRRSAASPRCLPTDMDNDLDAMTRDELVAEVQRLRQGIREHRDSTGHELCWHHPQLWGLLPEQTDPMPAVPTWPEFLRGCLRYRQSLEEQAPDAPRTDEPYKE